eukprot:gene14648-20682_t
MLCALICPQVAIVTAAGYPGEAHKFEKRLEGLLQAFRDQKLPAEVTDKFHIMKTLEFVPEDEWKTEEMMAWKEEDILEMLNEARLLLEDGAQRLKLPVDYIQKGRAVGIVPQTHTIYEVGTQRLNLPVDFIQKGRAVGIVPQTHATYE